MDGWIAEKPIFFPAIVGRFFASYSYYMETLAATEILTFTFLSRISLFS